MDGEVPLLGFEMYKRAKEIYNARSVSSVGDNPNTTVKILKALTKNKIVKMKHFYMLADKDKYFIAKIKGISSEELSALVDKNISKLFNITKPDCKEN